MYFISVKAEMAGEIEFLRLSFLELLSFLLLREKSVGYNSAPVCINWGGVSQVRKDSSRTQVHRFVQILSQKTSGSFRAVKKAADTEFAGDDSAILISVCVSASLRFRFPTEPDTGNLVLSPFSPIDM